MVTNTLNGPKPGFLSTSDSSLYSVPASTKATVSIQLHNTYLEPVTVRIHHTDDGISTQANAIMYDVSLPSKKMVTISGILMNASHSLRGLCNVDSAVTYKLSYVESA